MAITGSRVSVTQAATLVARGSNSGSGILVKNGDSTNTISIGGSTVTYAAGFLMAAGDVAPMDLGPAEELYGIADTGVTVVVHLLQKERA